MNNREPVEQRTGFIMNATVKLLPEPKLSYSINSAISETGLSRSRLYKMIAAGDLKTMKLGGRTMIPGLALRDALISGSEEA